MLRQSLTSNLIPVTERTLALVFRMALDVSQSAPPARARVYADYAKMNMESALEAGASLELAGTFRDEIERMARESMFCIETSGGATAAVLAQ